MKFLQGILLSELFVLWVEFFYKFGVNYSPKPFFMAIPFYFIYLSGLHGLFVKIQERRRFWIFAIVIGGIAGLMLEWFLVGNSPWNKPRVFQMGQFLYHGAYPILGYLLIHGEASGSIRTRLSWYMVMATGLTSVGFFLANHNLQKLWLLALPLLVYVGLYYFIYRLRELQLTGSRQHTSSSL